MRRWIAVAALDPANDAANRHAGTGYAGSRHTSRPNEPPPQTPAPRLSRTRIVAFGDSITEGVVSTFSLQLLLDLPGSYPERLRAELTTRYRDQSIFLFNEGKAGEWAEDGKARFPDVIRQDAPEVIILMEGANDLGFLGRKGISATIGQLETMVKYARARRHSHHARQPAAAARRQP